MTEESLQAENERLRAEVESYRQRELADLRSQLAAAREAAEHYRSEAHRNSELARQIDALANSEIARLKSQLDAKVRSRANAT